MTRVEVGRRLLSKYRPLDSYIRTFSNLPGLLIVVVWSGTVSEIRRVLRETCEAEGVLAVTLNFCYFERVYRTWRDKLPAVLVISSETARTRGPRRGTVHLMNVASIWVPCTAFQMSSSVKQAQHKGQSRSPSAPIASSVRGRTFMFLTVAVDEVSIGQRPDGRYGEGLGGSRRRSE